MNDANEWRFLRQLLAPHRLRMLAGTGLLLVDSACLLSLPWFGAQAAAALLRNEVPGALLACWLAVMTLQAAIGFGHGVLAGSTGARLLADLGNRTYDHLQALPVTWHQQQARGEVLAYLTNDVWRLCSFLTDTLAPLLPLLLTCAGALLLLMRIEPLTGLAVALGVPLLILGLKLATRRLRPLAEASLHEESVKHGIAEQNLSILPLIKAHTHEPVESARYAAQADTVRDLEVRQLRVSSALAPMVRLLGAAAVLGLLWVGSRSVAAGTLTPPDLVALLLYGLLLVQPVSQLASLYGQVQSARGAARRLLELFAQAPEPDPGTRTLPSPRGELAFERVAFAYAGRNPVFTALDLHVRAGETVAITGPNGAGKSTLAHLLMRFVDPQAGRVTLDGVDLRELTLRDLRTHVGLVSQHVLLLNASVAHNIGYGRYGANREQVEAAARAAHADEFVQALPQGYDTVVGDEGVRLSGGQRQRIALARALLKDSAVLILDEATAMFDPEGERDFIAQCHELLRARTVLLITHRPASLALADRVLRLEHGRIEAVATTVATTS